MNRMASRWRCAQADHEARQGGQALILAIICLLVLCLGLLAVFDTGQVVNKKEQLTNAADAAAYSVGIEQARALNTVAYFNRAEVANQIFVAQLVSLQSYANYADSLTGRFANLMFFAGTLLDCCGGEALQAAAEAIKEGQQAYAGVLVGETKAMDLLVMATNGLNTIYSNGETFVLAGFSLQSGVTTAENVVKSNTMDADGTSHAAIPAIGKGMLLLQLGCFVGKACAGPKAVTSNKGYAVRYAIPPPHYDGSAPTRTWEADRYANLVMQARDAFSASRSRSLGFGVPYLFKISTVKKGGTDLVDYNRWVAVDDLGLDIKIGPCEFFLPCKKLHGLTFGLGAAAALPGRMAEQASSSAIIKPGIALTKATGGPNNYHPDSGNGWYSPYDGSFSQPYQGALGNVAAGADAAAHPTDQGNHDVLADLGLLMGAKDPVPGDATPANVAWLSTEASGLQAYNDVASGKAIEPYATSSKDVSDVGPIFTVYVQQKDSTVRTGANIGAEGGDLKLKNHGVGGALAAVSSAQVFYDRPSWNLGFLARHTSNDANNGKRELGNLFEPYWQVRLVSTPTEIKVGLFGSQLAGL